MLKIEINLSELKYKKCPLRFFLCFLLIAAGSFFATRENCLHFTLWQIYVIFHHSRKNCFKVSTKYRKGLGSKKKEVGPVLFIISKKRRGGVEFLQKYPVSFLAWVFRETKKIAPSLSSRRWCGGPERAFLKKERLENSLLLLCRGQQQRSKMWRKEGKKVSSQPNGLRHNSFVTQQPILQQCWF